MPKLIIQIPAYNEEQTLCATLSDLPRELPGIDEIEWLVIDDGSTDRTAELARIGGADHVVRLIVHQGLARCFLAGIEACLERGADIIVNTDADNQYCADDIEKLVQPILARQADLVIGTRAISQIRHFSRTKKWLHALGTWVVQRASSTDIPDAPSGFRAFSREAAARLNVFNEHTYTLETIIQAGQKGMAIKWVPIRTNPDLRPSRLIQSVPNYVARCFMTISRIFMTYRPFRFFAVPGSAAFIVGLAIGLRFLFLYIAGHGGGHVQSLILGALLLGTGFFLIVIGLIADLIAVNRVLLEKVDWRIRQLEESIQRGRENPKLDRDPAQLEVGLLVLESSASFPSACHLDAM